jgi:hypothetical protein
MKEEPSRGFHTAQQEILRRELQIYDLSQIPRSYLE